MDDLEQRRAKAARRRAANTAAKLSQEKAFNTAVRVALFSAERKADSNSVHGDPSAAAWLAVKDARSAARAAGAAAALHAYVNAREKKPGLEEQAALGSGVGDAAELAFASCGPPATMPGGKVTSEEPCARGRVISTGRVGMILRHDLENGVVQLQFADGLTQWYEEDELKRYDAAGEFASTYDPGPWSWRPPEASLGPTITIVDLRGVKVWGPAPKDSSTPVSELRSLAASFFQRQGQQVPPVGVRLFHSDRLLNPDNSVAEADLCDGAVLNAKPPSAEQEALEIVQQLTLMSVAYDVPPVSPGAVEEKLWDIKRSLDVTWLPPAIEVCLRALLLEGKAIMDASVEFSMDPHKIADVEGTRLGYWSDAPSVQPKVERRCWPGLMYLSIYETGADVIFYVVDLCGELALLGGEDSAEGNCGAVWYAEARGTLFEVGTTFPMDFWDRAFKRGAPIFDLLPVKVAPSLFAFMESRAHGAFPSKIVRTTHGRDDRLAGKK